MKAKIAVLKDERIMVWVLAWTVLALVILYIYFMNSTVFNVAKRAEIEQDIALRSSTIGNLEFKYIALRNDIDMDLALSLGYTPKDPQYISKTPVTARVSFNSIQ